MDRRSSVDARVTAEESRSLRLRPLLAAALLIVVAAAFAILIVREWALAPAPVEIQLPPPGPATDTVTVHIGGAVMTPGVYSLPTRSRVADAVEEAGGIIEGADADAVNMAELLEDGSSYIVPPGENAPPDDGMVVVHVWGEVEEPGLYELPSGSRVTTALTAAGGSTERADLSVLNLAEVLKDGARYDVPTLAIAESEAVGDVTVHMAGAVVTPGLYTLPNGTRVIDAINAAGGTLSTADIHTLNLAEPVRDGARYAIPVLRATVNVNIAGMSELESVPGISRTIAQAIMSYREASGPFMGVDDLLDVPGIGPSTLAAIRPFVSVG